MNRPEPAICRLIDILVRASLRRARREGSTDPIAKECPRDLRELLYGAAYLACYGEDPPKPPAEP